jgi:hypothetical protein
MEEQRKANRAPVSCTIEQFLEYQSDDYQRIGNDDKFIPVKALNLSSGGIACESAAAIEPLSRVFLIFSIPAPGGSREIQSEGYVAHSSFDGRRCVFGIHFINLSAEDHSAIDAYIDAQVGREGP